MWNDIINYNQLILLGPQGKRELEWVITDFSGKGWENNVQALNGNSKCDRTEPTTIVWYETRDNQSQIVKLDENRWTVDDSFFWAICHICSSSFHICSFEIFWGSLLSRPCLGDSQACWCIEAFGAMGQALTDLDSAYGIPSVEGKILRKAQSETENREKEIDRNRMN